MGDAPSRLSPGISTKHMIGKQAQLYAFRPDGHGPHSFYVVAMSSGQARALVDAHVDKMRRDGRKYETGDWPHGYEMEVGEIGDVMENENG